MQYKEFRSDNHYGPKWRYTEEKQLWSPALKIVSKN